MNSEALKNINTYLMNYLIFRIINNKYIKINWRILKITKFLKIKILIIMEIINNLRRIMI